MYFAVKKLPELLCFRHRPTVIYMICRYFSIIYLPFQICFLQCFVNLQFHVALIFYICFLCPCFSCQLQNSLLVCQEAFFLEFYCVSSLRFDFQDFVCWRWSHYVIYNSIELTVWTRLILNLQQFLPRPSECRDFQYEPAYPVYLYLFLLLLFKFISFFPWPLSLCYYTHTYTHHS